MGTFRPVAIPPILPVMNGTPPSSARIHFPEAPALAAGVNGAAWLTPDGEIETLSSRQAAARVEKGARPVLCHMRNTARRLETTPFAAFDLLELFAFVRPARFCLPTPRGLAAALGLAIPTTLDEEAELLFLAARALLAELAGAGPDAAGAAWAMGGGGWPWAPSVLHSLNAGEAPHSRALIEGLRVTARLPEWEEVPPEPAPENLPVEAVEARARLVRFLGDDAEERPQQKDYASDVATAFRPRDRAGEPHLVLAEAGTGVGKTLGYLAPASLWAEKNRGAVWISTFTRNLQRQLDGELDRVFPDLREKNKKVVVRKGRENYFCLLNFSEAVARLPSLGGGGGEAVALGLMARWALASRDGDMVGGDFPAWMAGLLGRGLTVDLTDTRGECIYSACIHYRKCFIERSIRRARRASIVIANHALVMHQAAFGGGDEAYLPARYVFDEGHHLFGAADSAFSAHLSGLETADLRRWLIGAEEGRRTRSRGLKARIEDLITGNKSAFEALDECLRAARALPGPGWHQRIAGGAPVGPAEAFLARVRQQVYARAGSTRSPYSLETDTLPPVPGLLDAALALEAALIRLSRPLAALVEALEELLDVAAADMDTASRLRVEAFSRSLERRAALQVKGWCAMLKALHDETPPRFVDWFGVERMDGRDMDVGFHRHWIDPTRPFAEVVVEPAHGVLVTSASLRDASGDEAADQAGAETRTGAHHVASVPVHSAIASPFDYAGHTRVLVVGDVNRNDPAQVAAAYRELFVAAGGGGLGLFTAISRLKAVHKRIAGPLDEAGLILLAQHVDGLDTGTLIDIFRAENDACLLGTDAVRDGIDVPGRSLRLIVFDRVPWPRPDILHRARREAFGGRAHDEMLTRLKLKQAYGRLVRRDDDRGVFVMLDRALPSRLLGAFPEGVGVERLGLAEAVARTRELLASP